MIRWHLDADEWVRPAWPEGLENLVLAFEIWIVAVLMSCGSSSDRKIVVLSTSATEVTVKDWLSCVSGTWMGSSSLRHSPEFSR